MTDQVRHALSAGTARLRTGNDLGDFLSDGGLSCPVELQAQVVDHLFGIPA